MYVAELFYLKLSYLDYLFMLKNKACAFNKYHQEYLRVYAELSEAFMDVTFYLFFSHDITSEGNLGPCNNIDKPLVVY